VYKFGNKLQEKVLVTKTDEIIEEWRILRNKEFYNLLAGIV